MQAITFLEFFKKLRDDELSYLIRYQTIVDRKTSIALLKKMFNVEIIFSHKKSSDKVILSYYNIIIKDMTFSYCESFLIDKQMSNFEFGDSVNSFISHFTDLGVMLSFNTDIFKLDYKLNYFYKIINER